MPSGSRRASATRSTYARRPRAFAFLHSLGILRCDTACRNLLLAAIDRALVADLGYARKQAADKDCAMRGDVAECRC
jgi:hypothetical protein